jgi:hypothetical protein
MATWTDSLTTVASLCGIGAGIDFFLGRVGQQKVREFLELYWLRFSYLDWKDFGKAEALFAIGILDRLFGRRFLSPKRLVICSVVASLLQLYSISMTYVLIRDIDLSDPAHIKVNDLAHLEALIDYAPLRMGGIKYIVASTVVFFVSLNLALSLTRALSTVPMRSNKLMANIFFVILVVMGQYAIFVAWRPIFETVRDGLVGGAFTRGFAFAVSAIFKGFDIPLQFPLSSHRDLGLRANDILDAFILILRYSITAIFAISFMIRGFKRQISFVWLRVIETSTPFFTLLFGGVGTVATIIKTLIEHW